MIDQGYAKERAKEKLNHISAMAEQVKQNVPDVEAIEYILSSAIDVRVRQHWHHPGSVSAPTEYEILLCTGGPAVRIIGALDEYGGPITANIQYQDWGTSWTTLATDSEEENALLYYARCFYFAE